MWSAPRVSLTLLHQVTMATWRTCWLQAHWLRRTSFSVMEMCCMIMPVRRLTSTMELVPRRLAPADKLSQTSPLLQCAVGGAKVSYGKFGVSSFLPARALACYCCSAVLLSSRRPRTLQCTAHTCTALTLHGFSADEPNGGTWLPHSKPPGSDFAKLIIAVGNARNTAGLQGELLVGPATAGVDLPFIETIAQAGCLAYLDGISVHPYRSSGPESVLDDYQKLESLIDRYTPPLNGSSRRRPRLISGEWGWSSCAFPNGTAAKCVGGSGNGQVVTEQLQAAWLIRQRYVNDLAGVAVSIWYDWVDDGLSSFQGEDNFGATRNHAAGVIGGIGEPKPAYLAALASTALLGNCSFVARLNSSRIDGAVDVTFALQYRCSPGDAAASYVYVAWDSQELDTRSHNQELDPINGGAGDASTIALPPSDAGACFVVQDMYGASACKVPPHCSPTVVCAHGTAIALRLTSQPQYLVRKNPAVPLKLDIRHPGSGTKRTANTPFQPYPGPVWMHPRVHYAPLNQTAGDIAGALSHHGLHHVWQLTQETFGSSGSGWHHRTSRDLVRWQAASESQPVGPADWPSGFAIADDEQTAGRICTGMRCDRCKPDDPTKPMCALGKDNTSTCQQPPLALRCATNDAATEWGTYEPMFPIKYYRGLPYDPFRPFRDHDGLWYAGIAIDACNGTTNSVPCQAGGAIAVWSSPALRGPKADWQLLPHLLFTNNHSIYPGPMSQHGRAELVTIDFFGSLPGDASLEWRVIFNNCYDCRGATEYFIGKQRNGSKFLIDYNEDTHSMLDWSEFTVNMSAPPNARGVAALSRHSPNPTGGRLCMTRTLGDFATANQVATKGRRVAIGSVSGMCGFNISTPCTSMQSLPRDLSLSLQTTGGKSWPILLQAFVPELQILRRNHTARATIAFGQQLELVVVFTQTKNARTPFGLSVLRGSASEETTVLVNPDRGLVCINGTLQGNPEPRCAPFRSGVVANETVFHLIVDHSIITLIVNNVSAITASVAPSSAQAGGVALHGVQSESARTSEVAGVIASSVDIWTLADANNQPDPTESTAVPLKLDDGELGAGHAQHV